jgi:hypothetical protein
VVAHRRARREGSAPDPRRARQLSDVTKRDDATAGSGVWRNSVIAA